MLDAMMTGEYLDCLLSILVNENEHLIVFSDLGIG